MGEKHATYSHRAAGWAERVQQLQSCEVGVGEKDATVAGLQAMLWRKISTFQDYALFCMPFGQITCYFEPLLPARTSPKSKLRLQLHIAVAYLLLRLSCRAGVDCYSSHLGMEVQHQTGRTSMDRQLPCCWELVMRHQTSKLGRLAKSGLLIINFLMQQNTRLSLICCE